MLNAGDGGKINVMRVAPVRATEVCDEEK